MNIDIDIHAYLLNSKDFNYNSVNRTYDVEEGEIVFGITEEGDFDYFRIQGFQNDYNPDYESIKCEIEDRIKNLKKALKFLEKVEKLK